MNFHIFFARELHVKPAHPPASSSTTTTDWVIKFDILHVCNAVYVVCRHSNVHFLNKLLDNNNKWWNLCELIGNLDIFVSLCVCLWVCVCVCLLPPALDCCWWFQHAFSVSFVYCNRLRFTFDLLPFSLCVWLWNTRRLSRVLVRSIFNPQHDAMSYLYHLKQMNGLLLDVCLARKLLVL